MLNLCKRYKSKKNMILNESISLDTNVSEDSTLLDYIVNRDSPNPVLELDNSLFYNKLKELVYCESLIKGSIFELKLNGFTNKAISVLLDMNMCIVSRYFLQMKNKLKTILNYN